MTAPLGQGDLAHITWCLRTAQIRSDAIRRSLATGSFDPVIAAADAKAAADAVENAQHAVIEMADGDRRRALATGLHSARARADSCVAHLGRTDSGPVRIELSRFGSQVRNLREDIQHALDLIELIATNVDGMEGPSWSSRRLATWAVQLLPAGQRVRYREEFLSELHDLRELPRWQQLRYGQRLLVRALMLRRALRAAEPALEHTR